MFLFLQNFVDSDSDDSDEDVLIAFAVGYVKDSPANIKDYVEKTVHNYTRVEFQQNFRLTAEAFNFLQQKVSLTDAFKNFSYESVQKQLLAFIWILANQESYR
jgi:hypothetical protein